MYRHKLLLEVEASGNDSSKVQADLLEKRSALYRRISQWREVQLAYMPSIAQLIIKSGSVTLGADDIPDGQHSETIPLYLPSSLPSNLCGSPALSSLAEKELRLRKAQADESLEDIR